MTEDDTGPGGTLAVMVCVDYGTQALNRLHQLLGIGTEWAMGEVGACWSLWGAKQRVWSEPLTGDRASWRLRLRTRVLEGFDRSHCQRTALSSTLLPATLAGLVRNDIRSDRLELASTLDVHEGNFGWSLRMLAAAARVQAVTARGLVESRTLAATGLTSDVNLDAEIPSGLSDCPERVLLLGPRPHVDSPRWSKIEIAALVNVLRQDAEAHAVATPWGISASILLGGSGRARSILEMRSEVESPLLGKGVSVVLATGLRGGPLDALLWNEREIGPQSRGDGLGGWWAPEGGLLVHSSFYPDVLFRNDLALHFVLASIRRAREANAAARRQG